VADAVRAKTRATPRVAAGVVSVAAKKASASRVRVTTQLTIRVKRRTVIGFSTFPCRDGNCVRQASGTKKLRPGRHVLRFTARMSFPAGTKRACVFGQAIDQGLPTARRAYPLGGRAVCVRLSA
jgi:hypothetical protein